MKKTILAVSIAAAVLLTATLYAVPRFTAADENSGTEPAANAEIVRLTRFQGERITGISSGTSFQIELVKVADRSQNRAVVEIDADLESYLRLEIDADGVVKVGLDRISPNLWRSIRNRTLKMTLYLGELDRVTLSGSGSISVSDPNTTFQGDKLIVRTTGSGSIRGLQFRGDYAEVECTGSGSVRMTAYVREVSAKASGSGRSDLTCNGSEYAKVTVSGSGGILIKGDARQAELSSSGSGTLRGEEFKVQNAKVRSTGSGGIRVWAGESIEGSVTGSGSVRYAGNPSRINVSKSGSGTVRSL